MSISRCEADWGSATPSQSCVRPAGHGGVHIDAADREWGYVPAAEPWGDHHWVPCERCPNGGRCACQVPLCGVCTPHAAHPIPCRDEPWAYRPGYVMCAGVESSTATGTKRYGRA